MRKSLLFICIILSACNSSKITKEKAINNNSMLVDGKMFTALYQQKSAEYKALCLQAYNFAAIRVNQYQNNSAKPKAIIADIDETILDNSAYAVHQAFLGKAYDAESWLEWSLKSAADTVPGAPAFLKYAASKGFEIFYVTNRNEAERNSTLKNLRQFGLPNTDDSHLILRSTESSKESRRQQILLTHDVVLLLGDNLGDFSDLFDKKSYSERDANTNLSQKDFGNKFIVIPNPGYGDWEGALYNYSRTFSIAQKDSIYKSVLKSY